jgi:hypothetical protein
MACIWRIDAGKEVKELIVKNIKPSQNSGYKSKGFGDIEIAVVWR